MKRRPTIAGTIVFILCTVALAASAQAVVIDYDLTIEQRDVTITGEARPAMTINGSIPGPTLRFQEGDTARIRVHNEMDVETSIHWHGVLVPPGMDGVPLISFPPIAPGTTFTYEFPIRQSGTYWYHSHTNLQEQRGVYGSIVIEPPAERLNVDRDYVVLFSDWTDEDPHTILRTLKRGSEWYALQKGSSQSIIGAARLGMLGDYFTRELQRMPAMDIADVAYDRFLANGRPGIELAAEPGEIVRLRIIDGSATTYFHLEFAGDPMTIVAADGQDVERVETKRFLIAVAETYDVLVTVPEAGAYELRATAHDGSGHASVWIGSGRRHRADDVPRPNLYHTMGGLSLKRLFALTPSGSMGMPDRDVEAGKFDRPGMASMHSMEMGAMHDMGDTGTMEHGTDMHPSGDTQDMPMDHGGHSMEKMDHTAHTMDMQSTTPPGGKIYGTDFRPLASDVSSSEKLAIDGMDPARPLAPYKELRAVASTSLPSDKPERDIRLTLDGDMERYVWFMNNRPLSESDSILIRKGEVVRFIMINRTMMHHPMHLHGHFFRVINVQGDRSPLKHTVDVAPMSTTVIEFDANEFGDWFFHCHLLYHMKSGMARMVHYEDFTIGPELAALRPKLYKESWYAWGQADVLSNMTEGYLTASTTRNILTLEWEAGWQNVDPTEWEGIATWDRYINRFFTVFAGADMLGDSDAWDETRGVLGIRYLLPLNIESRTWIDTEGGARFQLEKEFMMTPRIGIFGEVEYDTHHLWEGKAGLSYLVTKNISLIGQWHSEYIWGGGVQVRF
jgi:FtsP/CotA-like multicopper oxidase with cupredoxin domain